MGVKLKSNGTYEAYIHFSGSKLHCGVFKTKRRAELSAQLFRAWKRRGYDISTIVMKSNQRAVAAKSLITGEVFTWPSMAAASLEGFEPSSIYRCCTGAAHTHAGFQWQYLN